MEFKRLFEQCLAEAGLSTRTLRQVLLRDTKHDLPENSIDSWRRPHSATGAPSLPREETLAALAGWLCTRPGVTVTADDLTAAWRADRAARAAGRGGRDQGPVRLARGEFYEGIVDATIHLSMDDVLGRVDHRLRELLNTGQPIPTYFMYLTHRGYLNWVARTGDHRYTYHRAGVLVHGFAYPLAEAAGVLGCGVSTLRNDLERGLARLRQDLGETDV